MPSEQSTVVPTRARAAIQGGRNVAASFSEAADTRQLTPLGTSVANPVALTAQRPKNQLAEVLGALNTLSGGLRSAGNSELFTDTRAKAAVGSMGTYGRTSMEEQVAQFGENALDPVLPTIPGQPPRPQDNQRHDELVEAMSASLSDDDPATTAATVMQSWVRKEGLALVPPEATEDEKTAFLSEYEEKSIAAGMKWWVKHQSAQQEAILENYAGYLASATAEQRRDEGLRPESGPGGLIKKIHADDPLIANMRREETAQVLIMMGEKAMGFNTEEGFKTALMAARVLRNGNMLPAEARTLKSEVEAARQKFRLENWKTALGRMTRQMLETSGDKGVERAALLTTFEVGLMDVGDNPEAVGNIVESMKVWYQGQMRTPGGVSHEGAMEVVSDLISSVIPDSEAHRQLLLAWPSLEADHAASNTQMLADRREREVQASMHAFSILQGTPAEIEGRSYDSIENLKTYYQNHPSGEGALLVDAVLRAQNKPEYTSTSPVALAGRTLYGTLLNEVRFGGQLRDTQGQAGDGDVVQTETQRRRVFIAALTAYEQGKFSKGQFDAIQTRIAAAEGWDEEKDDSDFSNGLRLVLSTMAGRAGAKPRIPEEILVDNNWFFVDDVHDDFYLALEDIRHDMTTEWYEWLENGTGFRDGSSDVITISQLKADDEAAYGRARRQKLHEIRVKYVDRATRAGKLFGKSVKNTIYDATTGEPAWQDPPSP